MNRSTLRGLTLLSGAAASLLLFAGSAFGQETLTGNAKFCDDFDQVVIVQGKLDEASKYLTDDFKEHNVRMAADGLAAFVAKQQEMKAAQAARGGGGRGRGRGGAPPQRTVLQQGDLVIFYSLNAPRPDPANPDKMLPATTHFDVYKLRGGKISEHWD
jgi:predicted SnoaL-like aldol condensation-catalyzing enzyme